MDVADIISATLLRGITYLKIKWIASLRTYPVVIQSFISKSKGVHSTQVETEDLRMAISPKTSK
jgi:hypothetical protein